MDIPNLPTDNLYKFLALGGLGAAAYLLWFIYSKSAQLIERAEKVIFETTKTEARVEAHETKRALLKLLPLDQRAAGLAELNEDLAEIKGDTKLYRAQHTQLSEAYERLSKLSVVLTTLAGFFLAIAIFGFALWYTQVQRYQDRILRATADSVVAAHASSPVSTPK